MIASCWPRCGSLLPAGPPPHFCPGCGGDLANAARPPAPARKPPLLLIALGMGVLLLFAGATILLRKSAKARRWVDKKAAVLTAARGGSAGMFRRAWDEAAAAAAEDPGRMPELR